MMILYHGTTKEKSENIERIGFSSKYQGENGNHLGAGIYLATTKKRAKCYGNAIVSVQVNPERLVMWDEWYPDYMNRCREAYESGTPTEKVNDVVGESIRLRYMHDGYTGIIISAPMSHAKEVVIYDETVIEKVWL